MKIKWFGLLLISCAVFAEDTNMQFAREIEQAKEAAPPKITQNASVRVWDDGKFKEVIKGTNGFTCLVMQNPEGRFEPSCLNRQAMAFVFATYEYHTRLRYQGVPQKIIMQNLKKMSESGELPPSAEGAIVYMQSNNNRFDLDGGKVVEVPPHLMFFTGKLGENVYGFKGLPGYPRLFQGYPHLSALVVPKSLN